MRWVVLHAADDDVSRLQFGRNLLRRELRSSVSPHGRAGDYPESGGHCASKLRDYLLRQASAQIRLCRVSVQVVEWQNGDKREVTGCADHEPPGGQQSRDSAEYGGRRRRDTRGLGIEARGSKLSDGAGGAWSGSSEAGR